MNRLPRFLRHLFSAPFIYILIVPVVFLDILIEIYHRICFPLYGLAYIPRRRYIVIDRHKLAYLDTLEKINCMYCGYVNGLFYYISVIASTTESYWCGIQHQKKTHTYVQKHQKTFLPYGDADAYEGHKESTQSHI